MSVHSTLIILHIQIPLPGCRHTGLILRSTPWRVLWGYSDATVTKATEHVVAAEYPYSTHDRLQLAVAIAVMHYMRSTWLVTRNLNELDFVSTLCDTWFCKFWLLHMLTIIYRCPLHLKVWVCIRLSWDVCQPIDLLHISPNAIWSGANIQDFQSVALYLQPSGRSWILVPNQGVLWNIRKWSVGVCSKLYPTLRMDVTSLRIL